MRQGDEETFVKLEVIITSNRDGTIWYDCNSSSSKQTTLLFASIVFESMN